MNISREKVLPPFVGADDSDRPQKISRLVGADDPPPFVAYGDISPAGGITTSARMKLSAK